MQPTEKRSLVKAAHMYYIEQLKQDEIARRMGINRSTVSKYLKRALEAGIVEIRIKQDSHEELESALERRFRLKEAYVVDTSYDLQEVKQHMAKAGLSLLRRTAADGDVIGLAWGTTIKALVAAAEGAQMPQIDADIVPIDGGPFDQSSEYHVNTLCYRLSQTMNCRSHYIYAPAITRTPEIRDAILSDVNYEKISGFWQHLTLAVVGIGAPVKSSNLVWMGDFGTESIYSLGRAGAVGEICSVFYDKHGSVIDTEFTDRTIAVPLDILKSLPYSIGMAAGREKVPAIMGALKGAYVNVLITDETTAKILLNE